MVAIGWSETPKIPVPPTPEAVKPPLEGGIGHVVLDPHKPTPVPSRRAKDKMPSRDSMEEFIPGPTQVLSGTSSGAPAAVGHHASALESLLVRRHERERARAATRAESLRFPKSPALMLLVSEEEGLEGRAAILSFSISTPFPSRKKMLMTNSVKRDLQCR